MKKNRKNTRRMSVMATCVMRSGAVVVFLFAMVIINILASSSCTQLMKEIGEKKAELKSVEDMRQRELSRWEAMCTPEKIEASLLANGLSMILPKHDQCIRMNRGGVPSVGQISVSKARQRNGVVTAKFQRKRR